MAVELHDMVSRQQLLLLKQQKEQQLSPMPQTFAGGNGRGSALNEAAASAAASAAAMTASIMSSRQPQPHIDLGDVRSAVKDLVLMQQQDAKGWASMPVPARLSFDAAASPAALGGGDGVIVVSRGSAAKSESSWTAGNQASEHAVALALAKDETERLRKALLDAEMDLQVSGNWAGKG